jgi:hypothetical protein
MACEYSIKINRRDGALEITGPEQSWVDAKLQELQTVYMDPLPDAEDGAESSTPSNTGKRAQRRPTKKAAPPVGGSESAPKPKAATRRRSGRPKRNPDLEAVLTREAKEGLQEYIHERQAAWDKKQTNQAVIIATYLHDELDWTGVDENDLYTVYRALGLDGPTNFRSVLQNAYNRDKFFSGMEEGKYSLSLPGENFARNKAKGAT